MESKEALGLPKGSIRAIAFLMVLGTMCWGAIGSSGVVDVKDFMSLVSLMAGFYFGQKVGKSGA